jgi:hypothetical protein
MKLSNCTVSCKSRRQRTEALSTTEAEYLAISDAAKDCLLLCTFLAEILCRQGGAIISYNNNQSVQKLFVNNARHRHTKHTDVKDHFIIRDTVARGEEKFEYKPTSDMTGDILTKPLCKGKHMLWTEGFGVKVPEMLE